MAEGHQANRNEALLKEVIELKVLALRMKTIDNELLEAAQKVNLMVSGALWSGSDFPKDRQEPLKLMAETIAGIRDRFAAESEKFFAHAETYRKAHGYASEIEDLVLAHFERQAKFNETLRRLRKIGKLPMIREKGRIARVKESPEEKARIDAIEKEHNEVGEVRAKALARMEELLAASKEAVKRLPKIANDVYPTEDALTADQIAAQDLIHAARNEMGHLFQVALSGVWVEYDPTEAYDLFVRELLLKYSDDPKLPQSWMDKEDRDFRKKKNEKFDAANRVGYIVGLRFELYKAGRITWEEMDEIDAKAREQLKRSLEITQEAARIHTEHQSQLYNAPSRES